MESNKIHVVVASFASLFAVNAAHAQLVSLNQKNNGIINENYLAVEQSKATTPYNPPNLKISQKLKASLNDRTYHATSLLEVPNPQGLTSLMKTQEIAENQHIIKVNLANASNGNQKVIKRVKMVIPPHNSYDEGILTNEKQYKRVTTLINNQVLLDNPEKFPTSPQGFIRPVSAKINSPYGMRRHPIHKKIMMHTGVDFAAPKGTPIRAAADGVVEFAGWKGGYGKMVLLHHTGDTKNQWSSLYGHASKLLVKEGQFVRQGDIIARVGSTGQSTGNHLHFEIFQNGKRVNPQHHIPNS